MGCRDDGRAGYEYGKALNTAQERLDKVTRMLCSLIQAQPALAQHTSELNHWWLEHQRQDQERQAAEAKAEALAKERREKRIHQLEMELKSLKER